MNGVLSASRLMKAAEVKKMCAVALSNPALLLAMEVEAKRRLFAMNMSKRMEVKYIG